MVLPDQCADTPAGSPFAPLTPSLNMPVAPVVVCVMFVNAVLIQSVGDDDAALTVLFGVTVIVPVFVTLPQPPVNVMVYVNGLPVVVEGVPLIVTTPVPALKLPFTPVGSPLNVAPVAPVVA